MTRRMRSSHRKNNDLRQLPLVEVTWDDTASSGGWANVDAYAKKTKSECRSVGYMTQHRSQDVQLAQSISDTGDINDCVTIPRSCIKHIRLLERKGYRRR